MRVCVCVYIHKYTDIYMQHEMQRHKFYGALKSRADKKEGWVKLQREMVCIYLSIHLSLSTFIYTHKYTEYIYTIHIYSIYVHTIYIYRG